MQERSNPPAKNGVGDFFGSVLLGIVFGVVALVLWIAKAFTHESYKGGTMRIGDIVGISSSIATILGCVLLGTGGATILKHMPKEILAPSPPESPRPEKKRTWGRNV